MQQELLNILKQIKLDEMYYPSFENITLQNVVYKKTSQSYNVTLLADKILDLRIYNALMDSTKNFPVPLEIVFELKTPVNEIAINAYFLNTINKLFIESTFIDNLRKLHIKLINKVMHITVNSQMLDSYLNENKNKILDSLNKAGILNELEISYEADEELSFENIVKEDMEKLEQQLAQAEKNKVTEQPKNNSNFGRQGYEKIKLNQLDNADNLVEFIGRIFDIEVKEIAREKVRKIFSIYVTDDTDSVKIRAKETKKISLEFLESLKIGQYLNIKGGMVFDQFARDFVFEPNSLEIVAIDDKRYDKAEEKRVELHLHSKMSPMDGVATMDEYVNQAVAWGHKAIALTDHGVVQSFPEAQAAVKGKNIKMIYGMEGYVVDDKYVPAHNPSHIKLESATYVIFDLETTGLSAQYDKIIEFGAVKVENGFVVDTYHTMINPKQKMDPYISKITNITDDMLISQPTIEEELPKIREFIGDSILVAHNGLFDVGFLNVVLKESGFEEVLNPIIDTLDLAHCIFPNLKRYSLGSVCRFVNVEYNEDVAHRADYDAKVLADVFEVMLSKILEKGIVFHHELNDLSPSDAYKSKRPYHMTFLVKNATGLKNLYRMVTMSHIEYITTIPIIPRRRINEFREGLLVGSACFNGEIFDIAQTGTYDELKEAMKDYDYIEVQPLANYMWLIDTKRVLSEERLIKILRSIVRAGKEMGKIVVATGDCHYLDPRDKIYRDVYIVAQAVGARLHPLNDHRRKENPDQHFRTTNEMIEGISYLDDYDLQKELVVTNTNLIADMIEVVEPIKDELFKPQIEGIDSDVEIRRMCNERARELYGENLPKLIEDRMNRELDSICGNGYSVIYYSAYRLVKQSKSDGYLVGSRGSVGSSFVASLCGITEVNPLPPHYLCPHCHEIEFVDETVVKSGFDLEEKPCPKCGSIMSCNGQNIPFETFLGFKGDKVPDIDLNFSEDYQARAHEYTKVLFGENNVFRAGTIGTVATKTAFGYARNYFESINRNVFREAELRRLALKCTDVKRTTGQHPGGIIVIPSNMDVHDFTPIQFPADSDDATWKTTHFKYKAIHDEVLKLDILGHVDPAALRMLQDLTGINPEDIPMNDKKVLSLFTTVSELGVEPHEVLNHIGSAGVPEFGTGFVKGVLEETKPMKFSDLVQISGLTHGTDVWRGNAQDLVKSGTCSLTDVVGCRDDIMVYLANKGIEASTAFKIMESVRKGKGLTLEMEDQMIKHNVPDWYITSCKKIKYMFPKAHAVAYVVMALRVAWYKIYYPLEYYATFFTVRCDVFDLKTMIEGKESIRDRLQRIRQMIKTRDSKLTNKDQDLEAVLEMALEMTARGYTFANLSLEKSNATKFVVDKENNQLIPPFSALDGLGAAVANSIVEAREKQPFLSKSDLEKRTQINGTQLKVFDEMHVLDSLDDENQLSLKLF